MRRVEQSETLQRSGYDLFDLDARGDAAGAAELEDRSHVFEVVLVFEVQRAESLLVFVQVEHLQLRCAFLQAVDPSRTYFAFQLEHAVHRPWTFVLSRSFLSTEW